MRRAARNYLAGDCLAALKARKFEGVAVLAGVADKTVHLVVSVSPKFTGRFNAGKLLQQLAPDRRRQGRRQERSRAWRGQGTGQGRRFAQARGSCCWAEPGSRLTAWSQGRGGSQPSHLSGMTPCWAFLHGTLCLSALAEENMAGLAEDQAPRASTGVRDWLDSRPYLVYEAAGAAIAAGLPHRCARSSPSPLDGSPRTV